MRNSLYRPPLNSEIVVASLNDLLADLTSGNESSAETAVSGLIELGDEAFQALHEMLNSENTDHRWWALRTLAQAPQSQARWLLPFLTDSAVEVRQAAALGLCSHPDETAIKPLIQALSDDNSIVSSLAGKALVAIGKQATPFLIEIPRDAPQTARINAIRALAEIADHSAIPALMAALEEDSVMIRHWAEEGLVRLGLDMVYLIPE